MNIWYGQLNFYKMFGSTHIGQPNYVCRLAMFEHLYIASVNICVCEEARVFCCVRAKLTCRHAFASLITHTVYRSDPSLACAFINIFVDHTHCVYNCRNSHTSGAAEQLGRNEEDAPSKKHTSQTKYVCRVLLIFKLCDQR